MQYITMLDDRQARKKITVLITASKIDFDLFLSFTAVYRCLPSFYRRFTVIPLSPFLQFPVYYFYAGYRRRVGRHVSRPTAA